MNALTKIGIRNVAVVVGFVAALAAPAFATYDTVGLRLKIYKSPLLTIASLKTSHEATEV